MLIEPIDVSDPNNPIQYLKKVNEKRQRAALVTLFSFQDKKDPQYGTCLLLKEDGDLIQHVPVLKDVLLADANKALAIKTLLLKIIFQTIIISPLLLK